MIVLFVIALSLHSNHTARFHEYTTQPASREGTQAGGKTNTRTDEGPGSSAQAHTGSLTIRACFPARCQKGCAADKTGGRAGAEDQG